MVHPSRERFLLLAACTRGSLTEPCQNTEIAPDVTGVPGSGSRAPRHLLLLAGESFRGDGPLVPVARLQALPVGGDVGPEILCQPDVFGKPQRIADHDVGGGEAIGTQRLG